MSLLLFHGVGHVFIGHGRSSGHYQTGLNCHFFIDDDVSGAGDVSVGADGDAIDGHRGRGADFDGRHNRRRR